MGEPWPGNEWAEALDALADSWRSGRMPGTLFHSTGAGRAPRIASEGLNPSEGMVVLPGGSEAAPAFADVVHLGTPEVASWYMRDTAAEREPGVAMVAVDVAGWLAWRGSSPEDRLLVDLFALDYPAREALGAPDDAEVRAAWPEGGGWRDALAVSGTIALLPGPGGRRVPARFVEIMDSPARLAAFAASPPARFARPPGPELDLVGAASRPMPWNPPGWRFRAASLRNSSTVTPGP